MNTFYFHFKVMFEHLVCNIWIISVFNLMFEICVMLLNFVLDIIFMLGCLINPCLCRLDAI